ncbi:Uma2 family endonuclease [Plectonema cf. radiosum LEGE 06105]|uniref:Uma2 family endonuclease n=1 Tax=Plectonema cf. radiosum LEGE 06105 TaxID=945769 RepID=A0A8J7F6E7_9CYAN|nr:Uma2 family endonuclease [Plectonema cf. radiosum LEGE 06105]
MENRLKIFRTQRNFSQAALAERLGVSRQTINAIEKGKYDPSLTLAMKIAQMFDCAIETIFLFEADSQKNSTGVSMLDRLTAKASKVIALAQGHFTFDKWTLQSVRVIQLAQQEARHLRHNFVGTEQILLGLIAIENGIAAKVLKSTGITLDEARVEVEKIIGRGSSFLDLKIPFTPRVKQVIELAGEQAHQLGHNYIDTEHLLLGLLLEGGGVGVQVLKILGVDTNNLFHKVLEEIRLREVKIPQITPTDKKYPTPIDFTSGLISARFCSILSSWVESHQLGYIVSSNTGFQLFNGDIIAPHISFYSKEKLKQVPRIYPELPPDLVVEIKSAFDQLSTVQNKIFQFLEIGIGSVVLINPDERTVTVYIYERDKKHIVNILQDGDKLSFAELFPNWELEVSQLWVT